MEKKTQLDAKDQQNLDSLSDSIDTTTNLLKQKIKDIKTKSNNLTDRDFRKFIGLETQ